MLSCATVRLYQYAFKMVEFVLDYLGGEAGEGFHTLFTILHHIPDAEHSATNGMLFSFA